MRPIDDLGAPELSALVRLAERGPLTSRGLAHAARASPLAARRAEERLRRLGLVERAGLRLVLTPRGRAVARHLDALEAILADRGI